MMLMNLIYPCSRHQVFLLGMTLDFLLASRLAYNTATVQVGFRKVKRPALHVIKNIPFNVLSGLSKHLKYCTGIISLVTLAGSKRSSAFTHLALRSPQLSSTGTVFENGY